MAESVSESDSGGSENNVGSNDGTESESTYDNLEDADDVSLIISDFVSMTFRVDSPSMIYQIDYTQKEDLLNELLEYVYVKDSSGNVVEMDVSWDIPEDFLSSEKDVYRFDMVIPENVGMTDSLKSMLDSGERFVPYVEVDVSYTPSIETMSTINSYAMWQLNTKIDFFGIGHPTTGAVFYDDDTQRLSYCGNMRKVFNSHFEDYDTVSEDYAKTILWWVGDDTARRRAGYVLNYGYDESLPTFSAAFAARKTDIMYYAATQILVWAAIERINPNNPSAGVPWDNPAIMQTGFYNLLNTTYNSWSNRTDITNYWNNIINWVNTDMSFKLPTSMGATASSAPTITLNWDNASQTYKSGNLRYSNGYMAYFNWDSLRAQGYTVNYDDANCVWNITAPASISAGTHTYNLNTSNHGYKFESGIFYYIKSDLSQQEQINANPNWEPAEGYVKLNLVKPDRSYIQIQKTWNGSSSNASYNPDKDPAIYGIYTDKACTKPYDSPYISGTDYQFRIEKNMKSGEITVEPGIYYVKETKAPNGWSLDTNVYTVDVRDAGAWGNVSNPYKVNSNNREELYGKLQLYKESSKASVTSGNANYSYSGAVYTLYDSTGKAVGTATTNSSGYGMFVNSSDKSNNFKKGTYTVKETKAPKGFILDTRTYTTSVTPNKTTTVTYNGSNLKETPIEVFINISKVSTNLDATKGNPNYTYNGAKYGVYKNSSCTSLVDTITVDSNGKGTSKSLPLGEYWIKETSASAGYAVDTKVYYIDARNVTQQHYTFTVNSGETPLLDPIGAIIRKVDSETGNVSQSDNGSFEGAEFLVKYYKVDKNMTTDPALSGHSPAAVWRLRTDSNGVVLLDPDYLVGGTSSNSPLYYQNGIPMLPFGVVTIQEVVAPEGYLLNNTIYTVPINGKLNGVTQVTQTKEVADVALSLNLTKVQSDTNTPIAGATFRHTRPDGTTEDVKTDSQGKLSFTGLQHGNHTVQEIDVPDGYVVNTNIIRFNVANNNKITIQSTSTETDTNGNITIKVENDGNISAVVEDKPAPFDLTVHKINNHNLVLSKAEFTLYSDAGCTQEVASGYTDDAGNLVFDDLIPFKDYWVKETDAPPGYRIPINKDGSDIVYKIRVESNPVNGKFVFYVNGVAYTGTSGDFHINNDKANRVVTMVITNYVMGKLPNTGSNLMVVITALGVALMGTAIFASRVSRKPDKSKN